MLVSELKKLKLQNELITVRRDCADEDQTGTIEYVNNEVTVMCLYTDDGEYEGYAIFYTAQIYEVLWGNREHQAIAALVKNHASKKPLKASGDSFSKLLQSLSDNYSSLCIYTEDEGTFDVSIIEKMADNWVKIAALGPKKTLSTLSKLVQFDDIGRIDVDSPYQNNIVKLHQSATLQDLHNNKNG